VDFVKLKSICEFDKGSIGLAKAEPGVYPLVTTGAKRKSCNTYQFDAKAVCIPLVSSTGHGHASLNNVHYQEGKFALGTILVALTSKDNHKLDIQFLHLYLSQLKDLVLVPLMGGAANVTLSVKKIQEVEILLPSIERQREIVKRFKSIVIEEDELKVELTHQQTLLKTLRKQILQEAIEGKLTACWREKNRDMVPASELLKRIAAEKLELVKNKKIKRQKSLPLVTDEEKTFELPNGWDWCRFQDVAEICSNLVNPYDYYDLPHIAPNHIEKNTGKLLPFQSAREDKIISGKHIFYAGQLLYSKVRPQLNKVAFAPTNGLCSADMYPIEAYIEPSYLQKVMLSQYFLNQVNKFDNRVKMPKINQNQLNSLIIPCPSIVEQKAISNKVDLLFALCDKLAAQIIQNQANAELLMQMVIREAFSHNNEVTPPSVIKTKAANHA
jgi:type I restriction enzyme S subunit